MSPMTQPALPSFDRNLLRAVERLVPLAERDDWSRAWKAELWHMHHRSRRSRLQMLLLVADLSVGLVRDALWLRTERWRQAYSGTPSLCIASLLGLIVLSALVTFFPGDGQALKSVLSLELKHTLVAAPFVIFVVFATAPRKHEAQPVSSRAIYWCKRQLFYAVKVAHVLVLGFLLSADVCGPIHRAIPNTAEILQIFCFVLISLFGLRWAILDQEARCKQCLQVLAKPARVGRHSHNLLEWNGTELTCKKGHGILNVPEMETSWCQSSQWVPAGVKPVGI